MSVLVKSAVKTAAQWKRFYADERDQLGDAGMGRLLDRAPTLDFPAGGALVFPHTRVTLTAHLTAAVALAVVRSGADEVLALGVLHGGREQDADRVRRARAGELMARLPLRGIHDTSDDLCAEEFSLDTFEALVALAARREGRAAPRVLARYPFLVADQPETLPGLADLVRLAERMPVVATADPIHHGAGYNTPAGERRAPDDEATQVWARACIETQVELLLQGDWEAFARLAGEVRSDFRDAGPVLGHLARLQGERDGKTRGCAILDLTLVDYSDVLGAEAPTWVAAPLMSLG
jgi:hypothetical protein